MLYTLLLIFGAVLIISLGLYLLIMAVLIVSYLLFCGPYLWWSNLHQPKDRRRFSLIRDYRNAFRYYRSKFMGIPPVFL